MCLYHGCQGQASYDCNAELGDADDAEAADEAGDAHCCLPIVGAVAHTGQYVHSDVADDYCHQFGGSVPQSLDDDVGRDDGLAAAGMGGVSVVGSRPAGIAQHRDSGGGFHSGLQEGSCCCHTH